MNERLRDYLTYAKVARNTSKDIQNDLLGSICEVYLAQVESGISSWGFVSIQPDETADVACESQLALVLCYVKCSRLVERFHCFVNVEDRSVVGNSGISQSIPRLYNVREKLIALRHVGAAEMRGSRNGVQDLIKREYLHAHFLHCYAHQLNLLVKECALIFLYPVYFSLTCLFFFFSFFAFSSERTGLLEAACKRALQHCA